MWLIEMASTSPFHTDMNVSERMRGHPLQVDAEHKRRKYLIVIVIIVWP